MPKLVGTINLFRSLVKYGLSSCSGGVGWHHCREKEYVTSPLGKLEYGIQDQDNEISQETFEGPSSKKAASIINGLEGTITLIMVQSFLTLSMKIIMCTIQSMTTIMLASTAPLPN